jgi:tetratricopeptide (TPR) repeat protein
MGARRSLSIAGGLVVAGALLGSAVWYGGGGASAAARRPRQLGMPLDTAPRALAQARRELQAFLDGSPTDARAAARLAEIALRDARVTGNPGPVLEAEATLRRAMASRPSYEGERALAAILLSQHRFTEAAHIATRLAALEPTDTWLQGVIGDAALERGDYDRAFDAFDAMARLRPDAPAYARVAYGRELQGDLSGALQAMTMAFEATSPHDLEAQAWHATQLADLCRQLGRPSQARAWVERALHTFPGYGPALVRKAEVLVAAGDLAGAADVLERAVVAVPTAGALALLGDVQHVRGRTLDAERAYARADGAWRASTPEPREHALFLAMRRRDLPQALALAAQATRGGRDIVSAEAHAWAAFQSGDLTTAKRQIDDAVRTGSRLRRLRHHAAAIDAALGDEEAARAHLRIAVTAPVGDDLIERDEVAGLARRLGLTAVVDAQARPAELRP